MEDEDKYFGEYGVEPERERNNVDWDAKEVEAREKIREKFLNINTCVIADVDRLEELLKTSKRKDVALANRVCFSEEHVFEFFDRVKHINNLLSEANSMLDSYIRFTSTTPDFKPINNMVYHLNTFLIDTQRRRFYQLWEKENKRYFKYIPLYNLVYKLSLLVNRVCGTMSAGGNFIVDVGKMTRSRGDDIGSRYGDRYGGLGGGLSSRYLDYGGVGGYDSSRYKGKNWREQLFEEEKRNRVIKQSRDIGDSSESMETP